MTHRAIDHVRLGARALTVAGGLGVFASLFFSWTRLTLRQLALLAVTANGSLGRPSLTRDAWQASRGVALALTAVALLLVITGLVSRLALILPAVLAGLAGLVLAVIQLSDPPSSLPSSGMPGVSSGAVAGSAAGTGETVAIIGIVIAEIAMQVMLAAAHADRRRRGQRRRQRAIGSAARASRGALPAGEAPDAPA